MNSLQAQMLLNINERLLCLNREFPISVYSTFLAVAQLHPATPEAPAPTIFEVSFVAGVPYTSVSRQIRMLGPYRYRRGRVGLGLIDTYINPDNRREKLVVLTPKGEALAKDLGHLLIVKQGAKGR